MDRRRRDNRADDDAPDPGPAPDRAHESSLPPTLQPLMFREPQPPPPRDSASRSTYEPRDDDEQDAYPAPAQPFPAPSAPAYPLRPAPPWDQAAHAQAQREQEVSRRYLPARPVIDDPREHQAPAYALHPEPLPVAGPSSIPHGSSTQYYGSPPAPAPPPDDPAYRARPPPPPPRPPTADTFEFHYSAPGYDPYRDRGFYRDELPVPSSFRPTEPLPPRRHQERVPPAPPMDYLRPYTGEASWERRDSRYESSYAPSYPDPPPPMEEYGPGGGYAQHREPPWQPEPARYPMPPPSSASSSSMQATYRQYQDVEHPYRPLPHEISHYSPPDPYAQHYPPPETHRYDDPRYEERRYDERAWPVDATRHESYTPVSSSSQSVYPGRSRPDEDMEPPPQKRPRSTEPRKTQPRKTEIACDFCRGRKLRCDGDKPVCGNCNSRGNVCTYRSSPRRRGPGKVSKAEKARRKAESSMAERDVARSSSSSSSHTTATSAYATSILPPSSYGYGYPTSSAYMQPHGGPPLPPGPPGPPPLAGPPPMTPVARRSVRTPTRPSYAEEPEDDEETERPDEWRGR